MAERAWWQGCLALLILAAAGQVLAQAFPARPIRLVVGFTPGGGVDINARMLAAKLSELLGQQVVVENKPGAGTNIANEFVARAAPDGHTLLINTGAVAINMSLYRNPGFDTLRDFAPVSVFSESQNIMVTASAKPFRSAQDVVAAARAKPGALTYASAGAGSTQHLAGELFKLVTRTDILHVPYKGSAPAITALIAGEVDLVFINVPAILPQVKAGRLRPLAAAGPKRTDLMPEVPTLREAGVSGVEVVVWYGVLAPAATPKEIVATLAGAIGRAARAPEIRARLLDQGAEPVGGTPEEFGALLKDEVAKWREVVRAAGLKPE
ncbi:MAG: tripartite tricarboxylate transporter substrate binding protein [Burkholderiales bacterium]|nr:tripartite tricarboxylate transporter substrate binding protein [Burkholderiales bacterium]